MIYRDELKKLEIAASQKVKEKNFWLARLSGSVKSIFPYYHIKPDVCKDLMPETKVKFGKVNIAFSPELLLKLKAESSGSDQKMYIFLTAALVNLINLYARNNDIVIGIPIFQQTQTQTGQTGNRELLNTVLVLRNRIQEDMTCIELLRQIKQTIMEAVENQNYPVEILARQLSRPDSPPDDFPLFDISILLKNIQDKVYLQHIPHNMRFSFIRRENAVEGEVEYNPRLYNKAAVESLVFRFNILLEEVLDNLEQPLFRLDLLTGQEKKQILKNFDHTGVPYPKDRDLYRLFEDQAKKTPDNIALHGRSLAFPPGDEISLTYSRLNLQSYRLAGLLIGKGVKPAGNDIVAIMTERSVEMIIGILGILKAGGAYLPIDPEYPIERINYMLKDSGAKLLVTTGTLIEEFEKPMIVELKKDLGIIFIDSIDSSDLLTSHLLNFSTSHSPNLAYIIYTSGTTGKPKGVMIEHDNVVRLMFNDKFQFDFNNRDIWVMFHSYCFDFSVWEMYGALLYGGKLVVIAKIKAMEPVGFLAILEKEMVTVLNQVPSAFYNLIPQELAGVRKNLRLRYVIFGGEALKLAKLKEWKAKYPETRLINMYGITETTVFVTFKEIGEQEIALNIENIGKPIPTLSCYVMDRYLRLLPRGAAGELCVGGKGVARGYLNNPRLTVERFPENPFQKRERLYRSGDLVRMMENRDLEYSGRIDQQVKIRGFRIELGEIENQLLRHPGVREAVVLNREERAGDQYLCAYIVPFDKERFNKAGSLAAELTDHLSRSLPGYMIPLYFIEIEKIPLTANGKVDRRALPGPELKKSTFYTAPRNRIEKTLVSLWKQVLGHPMPGIDDNFFSLGGHSLKATILMAKISKTFHVKVPLTEIFKTPTIRELALYIQGIAQDKYASVQPVEKREYYVLSSAQKRLYFLQRMGDSQTAYNMPFAFPLGDDNDNNDIERKLETALKKLIARHQSLRTSFEMVKDEAMQKIHDPDKVEFEIEHYDPDAGSVANGIGFSTGEVKAGKESQFLSSVIRDFIRPFDLSQAPLMRSGLVRLANGKYTWLVDIHHITADGTSLTILAEDLLSLYRGETLEPLQIHYKDFSQWQNHLFTGEGIKAQEEYWLGLYPDVEELPRLELPEDHHRPEVFTFAGDHYDFRLDREDAIKFKVLGARNGSTLYMSILAVLNILFYKYTGQTDIIIGSGIAGRPHADLQRIIGMFVNTLAMRNYPVGEKSYESFLEEVMLNCVNAFENQDVQFEDLVDKLGLERDPARNPLFDVSMVVQNFRTLPRAGSEMGILQAEASQFEELKLQNTTAKFDMTFFIGEGVGEEERADEVYFTIEYYTCIFAPASITRLAAHLKNIIKIVIQNPSIKLKDIVLISEKEKKQVLYEFNDTCGDYPRDKPLHKLFEDQVEGRPDRIAVVGPVAWLEGRSTAPPVPPDGFIAAISCRHLDEKANRLAQYLCLEKQVQSNEVVGVLVESSIDRIIVLLGVLKSGAAYLPLDGSLPGERIKTMIDDACVKTVISQKKFLRILNKLQWECKTFTSYLTMDTTDINWESETETSQLMDEKLWDYVAESAVDDITGGGWFTSYTGEPFTRQEMDEYGNNILVKLTPFLHPQARVLEVGCGSGISMFRIAPLVGFYYASDLSKKVIEADEKRVRQEGYKNIVLSVLPAHEIDKIRQNPFDLVIINSVVQSFPGHNYLERVIGKVMDLLAPQGHLFIGDILDQELKENLVREMFRFKASEKGTVKTKIDWSADLFVSRRFFEDLRIKHPQISNLEFSKKIHTIENELTKFRYDTLINIDKTAQEKKTGPRQKYQDDMTAVKKFPAYPLDVPAKVNPGDPAYIIYTSGSTGEPKGVMVEHKNVVRLVKNSNYIDEMDLKDQDRFLLTGAFAFDISTFEIWGVLLQGIGLYMANKDVILDAWRLYELVVKYGISVMHFIPQLLNRQLDNCPEIFAVLRCVLVGGDLVSPGIISRLRTHFRHLKILHMYGPTENTTFSTFFPVDRDYQARLPLGKPISHSLVYILDTYDRLQPVGVVGELCTGGDGVANGYLNKPELTLERFILATKSQSHKDVYFSWCPGVLMAKFYKTGDLARWLPDGNIEFFGRMDQQVKIRGVRIEPAAIERQLLKHPLVKETVVVCRSEETGDRYLCAYFVPKILPLSGFNTADSTGSISTELKTHLSRLLPEYMIPSYFIQIEQVPLTTNNKINRKALPAPMVKGEGAYTPPRDKWEEKLVKIWVEVLSGRDTLPLKAGEQALIGIDDNFFALGGHSLKATVLANRIHKVFNVKIPLAVIFKTPTVRGIGEYIRETVPDQFISITAIEKREYYVLSSAQKRMYFLQQLDLESTAYNMPGIYPLVEEPDINKLEEVFARLIRRHESLRTSFRMLEDQPVQQVHDTVEFKIGRYDLAGDDKNLNYNDSLLVPRKGNNEQVENEDKVADKDIKGRHLSLVFHGSFIQPFNLGQAPLLRVGLIKEQAGRHILMIDMHHIISDGISLEIMETDFTAFHAGKELPAIRIQYKDFSRWQDSDEIKQALQRQEEYWLTEFQGDIPLLNLPLDKPRPADLRFAGSGIAFPIDTDLTVKLKESAARLDVTLMMLLLSIYKILLAKCTLQDEIIVGTVISGREHADLEDIIGFFVNMLAIKTGPHRNKIFSEYLAEVKDKAVNAYENQGYPFEELVNQLNIRRQPGRHPLVDAVFVFLRDVEPGKEKSQSGTQDLKVNPVNISHFDLLLYATERSETISMFFEFSTDLFETSSIEEFIDFYLEILKKVADYPDIKLMDIEISFNQVSSPSVIQPDTDEWEF